MKELLSLTKSQEISYAQELEVLLKAFVDNAAEVEWDSYILTGHEDFDVGKTVARAKEVLERGETRRQLANRLIDEVVDFDRLQAAGEAVRLLNENTFVTLTSGSGKVYLQVLFPDLKSGQAAHNALVTSDRGRSRLSKVELLATRPDLLKKVIESFDWVGRDNVQRVEEFWRCVDRAMREVL